MRMNKLSIGFAAIVALAACGDDDGTGGTSGMSGSGGSGGGTSGTGGNTDCTLDAFHVTEPEDNILSSLSVGNDKVVFIAGNPTTLLGTIDAVGADGTGRTTLYTPTGSRRVHSVMADGDTVYFLEETENVVTEHELFSIPASGGTATRVGDATIESGYIVGFDTTHIFVLEKTINGSRLLRMAKSDGARELIGSATDGGTYIHVQLAGDDLFFMTGVPSTVYRLAKSASDVDATELWASPTSGDRCGFPLGGLFATGDKLVCGFTSLAARDRDGTGEVVLFDGDVLSGIKIPLASDGNNFYYADPGQGSALIRHDLTDDSETVVACDTGVVSNQRVDASFPIQNEYEVVVGSTDVFWIETTVGQDAPTFEIRRTPK